MFGFDSNRNAFFISFKKIKHSETPIHDILFDFRALEPWLGWVDQSEARG